MPTYRVVAVASSTHTPAAVHLHTTTYIIDVPAADAKQAQFVAARQIFRQLNTLVTVESATLLANSEPEEQR